MPAGDGTGPLGAGPRTGRGAGFCAGFGQPGYANPRPGYGVGFGGRGGGRPGGFGRGWCHRFLQTGLPRWARGFWGSPAATPAPAAETEKQWLESEVDALQTRLEGMRKRLDELSGGDGGE